VLFLNVPHWWTAWLVSSFLLCNSYNSWRHMKAPFSTISSQSSFKIHRKSMDFRPKPSPGPKPSRDVPGSWRSIRLVQSPWWAPSFPARPRRRASRSGAAAVKWMVPWNIKKYQENQLRGCIFRINAVHLIYIYSLYSDVITWAVPKDGNVGNSGAWWRVGDGPMGQYFAISTEIALIYCMKGGCNQSIYKHTQTRNRKPLKKQT
jgi:hypothetical protein